MLTSMWWHIDDILVTYWWHMVTHLEIVVFLQVCRGFSWAVHRGLGDRWDRDSGENASNASSIIQCLQGGLCVFPLPLGSLGIYGESTVSKRQNAIELQECMEPRWSPSMNPRHKVQKAAQQMLQEQLGTRDSRTPPMCYTRHSAVPAQENCTRRVRDWNPCWENRKDMKTLSKTVSKKSKRWKKSRKKRSERIFSQESHHRVFDTLLLCIRLDLNLDVFLPVLPKWHQHASPSTGHILVGVLWAFCILIPRQSCSHETQ